MDSEANSSRRGFKTQGHHGQQYTDMDSEASSPRHGSKMHGHHGHRFPDTDSEASSSRHGSKMHGHHGQQFTEADMEWSPGVQSACYPHGSSFGAHESGYHAHGFQTTLTIQRPKEASKQMLFNGFGIVLKNLEEFERRELKRHGLPTKVEKSEVFIPNQKKKSDDDVKSIVENQLLLLETQLMACPDQAKNDILLELKRSTFRWMAVRAEIEPPIDIHDTDRYLCQIYEILTQQKRRPHAGQIRHQDTNPKREVTEKTMKSALGAIFRGSHEAEKLDQEFKSHEDKKATAPQIRGQSYNIGADRMIRCRPDLTDLIADDMQDLVDLK